MNWFGVISARRKEIRRAKAEHTRGLWQRLFERLATRQALLVVVSGLLAGGIVNIGGYVLEIRDGERVARALTARVPFRMEDARRTLEIRLRAANASPNYYVLDHSLLQDISGRLTSALRIARESADSTERIRQEAAKNQLTLDDAAIAELIQLATGESRAFEAAVDRVEAEFIRQPLVEAAELATGQTAQEAVLIDPRDKNERRMPISKLVFSNNRDSVESFVGGLVRSFPAALQDSLRVSILQMLTNAETRQIRPVYRYDQARSAAESEAAGAAVTTQYVEYAKESRLIDIGTVSPEEHKILDEEHAAFLRWVKADSSASVAYSLALLSRSALAFLIVLGLGGYVFLYRDQIMSHRTRPFVTAAALLALLTGARITYVQTASPELSLGFAAAAAALLAIIQRRGAVYAVTSLFSLLLTLAVDQGAAFFVSAVAVTMTLLIGLGDIRYRGKIVGVGAIASLVAFATITVVGLSEGQTPSYAVWHMGVWACAVTLAAAFLVDGVLPAIERLFSVSTSMTLLEWCDATKPLLRLMAAEAPGTYNHSLMVGTLAEAAAESIGANGLLCRTGAYYHDIGKIRKPEYFVENQSYGVKNIHERLSPQMSLLIIINHVKDGVEMAKEYRLPKGLHPFIAEHHGTMLVEYFYHAANKARKPNDPEVDESGYRYPGPKPQSRDTAIVMLADGIEAAVRAMSEPTPARIEDIVRKIAERRLADGQFDECDLTFRELATVCRAMVKSLNSIYHARIAYPSREEEDEDALDDTRDPVVGKASNGGKERGTNGKDPGSLIERDRAADAAREPNEKKDVTSAVPKDRQPILVKEKRNGA